MDNVIKFEAPDNPENIEALRAMVAAARTARGIGFDRETFVRAAGNVFDGVVASELAEELGIDR